MRYGRQVAAELSAYFGCISVVAVAVSASSVGREEVSVSMGLADEEVVAEVVAPDAYAVALVTTRAIAQTLEQLRNSACRNRSARHRSDGMSRFDAGDPAFDLAESRSVDQRRLRIDGRRQSSS